MASVRDVKHSTLFNQNICYCFLAIDRSEVALAMLAVTDLSSMGAGLTVDSPDGRIGGT